MFASESGQLALTIQKLAESYGHCRSGLLPTLQHIQRQFRHISPEAMQEVADAFRIHPVEVQGVVSFYSFLSTERKGKFVIRLCQTISCDMQGKAAVARQLENELGIRFGETTKDGLFTLEFTNCIGMCDQGPALLIDEDVFTRVAPAQIADILDSYRKKFGAHVTQEQGGQEHHG